MTAQEVSDSVERAFIGALEYAASAEISLETALTHLSSPAAAAIGTYAALRSPELLAQRSPHQFYGRMMTGHYHPGDDA